MDLNDLKPQDLTAAAAAFSHPLTRKISDYLAGSQLGPRQPDVLITGTDSITMEQSIAYWSGDLLPPGHPAYAAQVKTIRRSFAFRNLIHEGVQQLADGVGADEPDWGFVLARPLAEGEAPTTDEAALIAEAETLVTVWWDERDIPTLVQEALISAIAHGRQALRPRLPQRFRDKEGRLKQRETERSLDPLWFVLPEVADAGIYRDPESMERVGITRIWTGTAKLNTEWEVTSLDEDGKTVIRTVDAQGNVQVSEPLDLGGHLWLLELKFPRGIIGADAISQQDARNVASTALGRNTRFAAFEKTIFIGVNPALDAEGKPKPTNGAGAEAFLQPTAHSEVELTGEVGSDGPVSVTRQKLFTSPTITKLDPSEPKAIQAAIDQATEDLYGILRQLFMLMSGDGRASGRSREVSTGPYLRACARYAAAVEALYRQILSLALRVSGLVQGEPGRYDSLRPGVTCRQRVFEPSPDSIRMAYDLYTGNVISRQSMRAIFGINDSDAEDAQIAREGGAPEPQPKTGP